MGLEVFQEQLDILTEKMNKFFLFVSSRLKNFPDLSLGEQIAYPCVGAGFLLILISVVLFII